MSGTSREASWMSGNCGEALLYVREWSGDPPSCPGVVGGPPGSPGVVESLSQMSRRPSRMCESAREWSKSYPECPQLIRSPSRMSGSG